MMRQGPEFTKHGRGRHPSEHQRVSKVSMSEQMPWSFLPQPQVSLNANESLNSCL